MGVEAQELFVNVCGCMIFNNPDFKPKRDCIE